RVRVVQLPPAVDGPVVVRRVPVGLRDEPRRDEARVARVAVRLARRAGRRVAAAEDEAWPDGHRHAVVSGGGVIELEVGGADVVEADREADALAATARAPGQPLVMRAPVDAAAAGDVRG